MATAELDVRTVANEQVLASGDTVNGGISRSTLRNGYTPAQAPRSQGSQTFSQIGGSEAQARCAEADQTPADAARETPQQAESAQPSCNQKEDSTSDAGEPQTGRAQDAVDATQSTQAAGDLQAPGSAQAAGDLQTPGSAQAAGDLQAPESE
jgi:hypothetical protein